jgi:hypothetical protein
MILAQKILKTQPSLSDFENLKNHKNVITEKYLSCIYIIPVDIDGKKIFFLAHVISRNWDVWTERMEISFFMDERSYAAIYTQEIKRSPMSPETFKDRCEELTEEKMLKIIKSNYVGHLKIVKNMKTKKEYCLYEREGSINIMDLKDFS